MTREEMAAEAKGLGIDVDGRWSDDTLKEHIMQAKMKEAATMVAAPVIEAEPTLHDMNRQQKEIDRRLREEREAAADAARDAVAAVMKGRRGDGKRTQKDLRPTAK